MFEQLDTLILMVGNMDASTRFYQDLLGLELEYQSPTWTTFRLGNVLLGLHSETPGTEDERAVKYGIAMAFQIDDVETAWRDLQQKGAHVLAKPREGDFGRYAEITDPDGHIIILLSNQGD